MRAVFGASGDLSQSRGTRVPGELELGAGQGDPSDTRDWREGPWPPRGHRRDRSGVRASPPALADSRRERGSPRPSRLDLGCFLHTWGAEPPRMQAHHSRSPAPSPSPLRVAHGAALSRFRSAVTGGTPIPSVLVCPLSKPTRQAPAPPRHHCCFLGPETRPAPPLSLSARALNPRTLASPGQPLC